MDPVNVPTKCEVRSFTRSWDINTLFSRQNLQTFDISHAFLPLTIAKLSTFKNGPGFLAHPVYERKTLLPFVHSNFAR